MPDGTEEGKTEENLKDGDVAEKNKGDDTTGGDSTGEGDKGGEDTVTISKAELDKIKSDRDNYRDATLDKKSKERELKKQQEGDDTGADGDDDADNTASIDETKTKQLIDEGINTYRSGAEKSNEERAKKKFYQTHKEYLDDLQWKGLMSNFSTKRGKATPEDIVDDLEDAVLLHKKETGQLDEYLKAERERGKQEGMIDATAQSGNQAGNVGDKNEDGSGKSLSEQGKIMSQAMGNNPDEVAKVDPSRDNVIEITQ